MDDLLSARPVATNRAKTMAGLHVYNGTHHLDRNPSSDIYQLLVLNLMKAKKKGSPSFTDLSVSLRVTAPTWEPKTSALFAHHADSSQ